MRHNRIDISVKQNLFLSTHKRCGACAGVGKLQVKVSHLNIMEAAQLKHNHLIYLDILYTKCKFVPPKVQQQANIIARYTVTVKSLNAKKVRLWANSYGWTKGQETPLVLRITLWTQGEILMLYNKSKVPLKMMEKLPLHCSVNIYITRRKGHPRWRPNQSTSYVYYLTVYGKNCINSAAIQCINGTHWGRRKNILHHHTSSLLHLTRITSFYIRL